MAGGRLYQGQRELGATLGQRSGGYTRTIQRGGAGWTGQMESMYQRLPGVQARRGFGRVLSQFQAKEKEARAANIKRYEQAMSIYDKIIARFQPGGAFEKRGLGEIARHKTKGVGQETQQLISSGLYGTTTMGGVGRRWEAEVGAPARMTLEDLMQQRVSGAEQAKAGFIERRQDPYPDYSMLAGLASRM